MKITEVDDYQAMSRAAADLVVERVRSNPQLILGLATGSTPLGLYQHLIDDYNRSGTSYRHVTTFNLDEYVGLSEQDPNSYHYFMNQYLFNHIDIEKTNTYIPKGNAQDLEKECSVFEERLKEHGGVDLQILGIGGNGHIGFNEPGTSFYSRTHLVDLTLSTREANERFFANLNEVPIRAVSMGIETIMESKEILLLISGEKKRDALHQLLHGEIDESFPASILREHPNTTVIFDKAAAGGGK